MYPDAPRGFFPPPLTSPRCAPAASTAKIAAQPLRSLLTLALLVLLHLLEPGKLFAQQTPPSGQGWSQNDQYNGQYPLPQQPDYEQQPDVQPSYTDSSPARPLNAAQLEQLVAPIALYPDRLVAQVLAASTFPDQVADARYWRQMQGDASPDQIAAGADAQNWDPSVKALVAFPQVLAQMNRNQQWTSDLGNAHYNQPQDVLLAVQVMRRRAQAAGTLESTPQQAVDYDQGYIQLIPVNPEVVYVPTYNPWTVYGEQVSPYPGFSLLGSVESFLGSSPITYGLGIAISAFSHAPWGWLAWGLNWFVQSVLFNESNYYSHSNTVADWGFRHDGLHAYAGRAGFAGHTYYRTADGFHRFGGGYNWNRGREFGRQPGRYAENWRRNSNNGFHRFGGGDHWIQSQSHNNMRAPKNWRPFDRRSYRSSWNRGTEEGFRSGARTSYARSMQPYRAPAAGFQRGKFGGSSSGAFASSNFARSAGKPPHSGGFHLFGGGHAPKTVSSRGAGGFHLGGSEHTPKSFHGSGRNFGGGHSHSGGGHSGGHGGGRHHR